MCGEIGRTKRMEMFQHLEIRRSDGTRQIVKLTGTQAIAGDETVTISEPGTEATAPKEAHVVIAVLPAHRTTLSPPSFTNLTTDNSKTQLPDDNEEHPGGKTGKQKKQCDENQEYPCAVCGKVFARPAYLVLHMRTHTGERPYSCKICDKNFTNQSGLNRHLRIHNGARPYKCKYCDMAFTQSTHRNTHVKAHEMRNAGVPRKAYTRTDTGDTDRPFECEVCGKAFPTRVRLRLHEKMHTNEKPFTCAYCGSGFRRKHAKVIHERSHTGDKPYQCSYCDKTFVCSTGKKCHERTHTGEKPYCCTLCGLMFATSSSRASHITNIHTNPIHSRTVHPRPSKLKSVPKITKKEFNCLDCSRSFALELSLKIHRDMLHDKI